ncbi:MAG TPA: GNAT family N-acetyltransferase [Oscillospiraceae bacterium]|nr:GNAT family N-acetyltransferase [Oscillospiraceae bacterium]
MEDFVFSRAAREDAPEIAALYRRVAAGNAENLSGWNDEYPTREFADADLKDGAVYVARLDGKIVASVSRLPGDDLDDLPVAYTPGRSCVMNRLCGEPPRQREGLGRRLAAYACAAAKAEGCVTERHLCLRGNDPANRLHEAMGCRRLGEARLYDLDFIVYERVL